MIALIGDVHEWLEGLRVKVAQLPLEVRSIVQVGDLMGVARTEGGAATGGWHPPRTTAAAARQGSAMASPEARHPAL